MSTIDVFKFFYKERLVYHYDKIDLSGSDSYIYYFKI